MARIPVAVLDTCVLAPMPLADTLLRLAEPPGLFRARWTDEILAELSRTLTTKLRCSSEQARSRVAAMRHHFPSALVHGHEALIARMPNDPKDRHVLAAAVRSGADYVVTFNLKDFSPVPSPAARSGAVDRDPGTAASLASL